MPEDASPTTLIKRLQEREAENQALRQRVTRSEMDAERYRRLYEHAPAGMYEIDFLSGRCVSVNRFVLDFTGYTRQEFLSMGPLDFLTEASRTHFLERLEKIERGQTVPASVEFQIKIKDGRTMWAAFEMQYICRQDRVQGASVVIYNINERKRALMALEESEQRFRRLVETMNEGLIIIDDDHRIVYINHRLEEISGFRAEELVGQNVAVLFSLETSKFIGRRIKDQEHEGRPSFEISWKGKKGEKIYSIISPQILPVGEGSMRGSFAVITDITARKRAEEAAREREKELLQKNDQLEEVNTALRTLAKMREHDKSEIEKTLSANLQQLVEPLLEKLRQSGLNDRQKIYTDLIAANLEEIASSMNHSVSVLFQVLTPAEIEVANLVKHGRTTKEIASLMHISVRTVDMHRLNIRRKLGLKKKGTNLRSYLLST